MDNVYEKAIKNLSAFFETSLQADTHGAGIFEPFRQVINFDEGYVFFITPENITVKYAFGKNKQWDIDDKFLINDKIKLELFKPDNKILDLNSPLIELLALKTHKSFITAKLIIRETVYGFVLLCKKEMNYYKTEDLDVASALGSIISYKIKDAELSEIFKIQLEALKDGLNQTKQAYKTIKEQNVKIVESDRIRNEFLANISHELRTPLNAIIGFSEVLSNQLFGELNHKQAEYINDIHVSGIHLLGLINGILDISKIEAQAMNLNRTSFELNQAINEVTNIVKPLANKKLIEINKNIIDNPEIFADFQKIKQVLYNLLSNAIKFSEERDEVTITTKVDNKNFVIEIKDNGVGIDKKDQEKIFDKFIQLENAYTKTESSTGLGLTITKELIEMHNGKITVKSKIGKGATFIVSIPNVSAQEVEKKEEERKKRKLEKFKTID